jgi:hypothetical protein
VSGVGARLLLAALLLALWAAPATAGGVPALEGSWELKISCKGIAGQAPTTRKETLFLPIVDGLPGDIQAGAADTGAMTGYVLYESAKPEKVRISLVGCNVGILNGLVLQASGKIVGDSGRLKGTAIFLDASGETAEICKAKLERTNAMTPPVLSCS